MEWSDDFTYSPLEESLYGLLSPPQLEMPKSAVWTSEENKAFENALAELDPSSPAFFKDLASKVPWRSVEELKIHYQALVQDVEMIESGAFPIPDYPAPHAEEKQDDDEEDHEAEEAKKKEEGPTDNKNQPKTKTGHPRRRGVPWTEEEHQLFLMGLNKYGKGDWRSISRYYVIAKTPTQVASHAQKYFRRQTSSTPPDRRRPSIHDIHTVNPPPPPANMGFAPPPPPLISLQHQHQHQQIPFSSCALIPTLNHQGFINGGINLDQNVGGINFDQNGGFFPPVAVNSAANDHVLFNQPPSAAAALPPLPPSSPYFLPSFRNQNWGSL